MTIRVRSTIDNRHNIRNPYGPQKDLEIWANTLLKTRIPTLFLTPQGLKGHAQQIQNELNRLGTADQLTPALKARAICVAKLIKSSLIKAKNAAEKSSFSLHWQGEDCFPHFE
jgi:hypothetical protein